MVAGMTLDKSEGGNQIVSTSRNRTTKIAVRIAA